MSGRSFHVSLCTGTCHCSRDCWYGCRVQLNGLFSSCANLSTFQFHGHEQCFRDVHATLSLWIHMRDFSGSVPWTEIAGKKSMHVLITEDLPDCHIKTWHRFVFCKSYRRLFFPSHGQTLELSFAQHAFLSWPLTLRCLFIDFKATSS